MRTDRDKNIHDDLKQVPKMEWKNPCKPLCLLLFIPDKKSLRSGENFIRRAFNAFQPDCFQAGGFRVRKQKDRHKKRPVTSLIRLS